MGAMTDAEARESNHKNIITRALGHRQRVDVDIFELTLLQKDLQGAIFGGLSPRAAVPELLSLYQGGQLKLDELVTTRYALEDSNKGYQDMRDGQNIRGMIVYGDSDR